MKEHRKVAKRFIRFATKAEYLDIVEKAFLTMRQEKILLIKKTNEQIANWQIGEILNVSVDTINQELLIIYDKIDKVLKV